MTKLKSCPFCGSDNIKIVLAFHPKCLDCGTIQERVSGFKAVESWNTRADGWVSVDTPEDVQQVGELYCFDGCDVSIDYVEHDPETGIDYMANGTELTHYKLIELPNA